MTATKFLKDFEIVENAKLSDTCALLKLRPVDGIMPRIYPGQFVQVEISGSKATFLRRPISVNFVDYERGQLWLLTRNAGSGTNALINTLKGTVINILLPLGNGFTVSGGSRVLLVGGGVGVAPLLYLGKILREQGTEVTFLLGARSEAELLELDEFAKYGKLCLATEDGSAGVKGFVTSHAVIKESFDMIQCCGPLPMMRAVAKETKMSGTPCEVSLENVMACGMGACLCCVEDTKDAGNVCVCTEGPVFDASRLKWDF